MSQIYQPKSCKDGGSCFYKNQKYRWFEIEKKPFFSVIPLEKFLIFPIWAFPENAQCLVGAFL